MSQHSFHVPKIYLHEFLKKATEPDDMRGNQIKYIIETDPHFVCVFIEREYSYPFIINQLEAFLEFPNQSAKSEQK